MPVQFSWYQADRILLVEMIGLVTIADTRAFASESAALVASGKPLVHVLFDARAFQKIESVPEAIKIIQANPPHPNTGWMTIIGVMNPTLRFFFDFAGLITRGRYRRFDTMPDAITFLKDIDGSLVAADDSAAN